MKVKFKDGHVIKFNKSNGVWLAESNIYEDTDLHNLQKKYYELETEVSQWFEENAPEKTKAKYKARLALRQDIKPVSVEYQIADCSPSEEDDSVPEPCEAVRLGWFDYPSGKCWWIHFGIRLCLEEK